MRIKNTAKPSIYAMAIDRPPSLTFLTYHNLNQFTQYDLAY